METKNKYQLQPEIEELKKQIKDFEIDPDDYEDSYCEMIDDMGEVTIGNLSYQSSRVLREVDPIAYRCGLLDYVDGIELEDDPKYKELTEELDNLQLDLDEIIEAEEEARNTEDKQVVYRVLKYKENDDAKLYRFDTTENTMLWLLAMGTSA